MEISTPTAKQQTELILFHPRSAVLLSLLNMLTSDNDAYGDAYDAVTIELKYLEVLSQFENQAALLGALELLVEQKFIALAEGDTLRTIIYITKTFPDNTVLNVKLLQSDEIADLQLKPLESPAPKIKAGIATPPK